MREPEGIETPLPGRSSEKDLVITPRTRRSQCRGRGFESLHLHQRPVQVYGLKVEATRKGHEVPKELTQPAPASTALVRPAQRVCRSADDKCPVGPEGRADPVARLCGGSDRGASGIDLAHLQTVALLVGAFRNAERKGAPPLGPGARVVDAHRDGIGVARADAHGAVEAAGRRSRCRYPERCAQR